MIEFDTLCKNFPETPPLFIIGNVKKKFFSEDNFSNAFRYSVVIRAQIWLSVGIKESTPNNDN